MFLETSMQMSALTFLPKQSLHTFILHFCWNQWLWDTHWNKYNIRKYHTWRDHTSRVYFAFTWNLMSWCLTFSLIICNFTLQRWFDTSHYNFVTKAFVWQHNQERYMLLKYKISHLRLLLGQWKTMAFLSWYKFSLQKIIIHVAILQRQLGCLQSSNYERMSRSCIKNMISSAVY